MAIGLAFVDIIGDTTRTEQQVERDMNRVLAVVEEAIDPVDIQAAVDSHAEEDLLRELNRDIRAAQAAISAINVDARLDPQTQQRLTDGLKEAIAITRARADQIKVRVDNRAVVTEVVAAVEEAQAAAPTIEIETRVDNDRLGRIVTSLAGIGRGASAAVVPVSLLGGALVGLTSSVHLLGGVVLALEQIAPAAAVAAPAILSVGLAIGTVKLATSGVSDAIKAAFDTAHPEKFGKALENLSPNAAAFVRQLHAMQPALQEFQQAVQNQFFQGFTGGLKELAATVLPTVQSHVLAVAGTLNTMALGAAGVAANLGRSGVLGKALDSASIGLQNFAGLPALAVDALGKIAAAAGPAFDRVTAGIAKSLGDVAQHVSTLFATGGLQNLIDAAVTELGKLLDIGQNIFTIFSNIGAQAGGFTSIIDVLKAVTDQVAKFTATKGAQDAFKALFDAADLLANAALPVLETALTAIGPVITALQPGFDAIVNALGPTFEQIISALGPVLTEAAKAVSAIAVAGAPLIPLFGQLVSAVLPALTPILGVVTTTFTTLAPIIAQVASVAASTLVPVLTTLATTVVPPLAQIFSTLVVNLLPILGQLIVALAPSLVSLSESFVKILVAVAPLLTAFGTLLADLLPIFVPLLTPIIDLVGKLAAIFADQLAQVITTIVVPALTIVTDLLNGDFSGAFRAAKDLVKGILGEIASLFVELPLKILDALGQLAASLIKAFGTALDSLEQFVINRFPQLLQFFLDLPGRISNAIGDLNTLLVDAGRAVIHGLANGIRAGLDDLAGVLGSVTDFIRQHKGPPELDRVLLTPAGESIMAGLVKGFANGIPGLESQLGVVNGIIGGAIGAGPTNVGVGSNAVPASAASAFAAASQPSTAGLGVGAVNVQVMLGTQQITDILDVRIAAANRATGRSIINGSRA